MCRAHRAAVLLTVAVAGVTVTACGSGSSASGTPAPATPASSSVSPTSARSPSATGQPPAIKEDNPPGDIPDTQAFVSYGFPSGAFSVKVPEGWARAQSNGVVTFTSHFNSARLEVIPAATAPTVASAQSSEAPAIAAQATHATVGTISAVTRPAGAAVLINYEADSAPDPVTGHYARVAVERYEFWRNGTEAVISLAAPVGGDNVDPWRKITDSFQWS